MTLPEPKNVESSPAVCRTGWSGFLSCHSCKILWLGVLVALVVFQWPMIRGMGYRMTAATPPESDIAWRTDFDAALVESKETGKPVLINFTADWCPPCQVMKHQVWPDQQVGEALAANYIPLLIDVDQPANQLLGQRYNVRTIPAVIVVDSNGEVLRSDGYLNRSAMLRFLKDVDAE